MNTRSQSRLTASLLTLALLATSTAAMAQVGRYDPEAVRAHHKQTAGTPSGAATASKFPLATRVPPEQEASRSGGKVLNDVADLYKAKQYPEAIQKAEALGATSTNPYERSFAYQLAATAAADSGDKDKAAADFKLALDSNGLDNDLHYQVMYNLAVVQYQAQHLADAVATIDRLTGETHVEAPQYLTLKAAALAGLHRPLEAAQLFEQVHARNPADTQALMNAVAAYQQANQPDKATALLATAKDKSALNDASQYRSLYVGYLNANKPAQALAVIEEGLSKGVIKPSPDLAQAYVLLAQAALDKGDIATTIAMYQRAAPMAADGEPSLNLARVLWNQNRKAEAAVAAKQSLAKGVKDSAEAHKLAGQAER